MIFCGFRCATTSPITFFYKLRFYINFLYDQESGKGIPISIMCYHRQHSFDPRLCTVFFFCRAVYYTLCCTAVSSFVSFSFSVNYYILYIVWLILNSRRLIGWEKGGRDTLNFCGRLGITWSNSVPNLSEIEQSQILSCHWRYVERNMPPTAMADYFHGRLRLLSVVGHLPDWCHRHSFEYFSRINYLRGLLLE